MRKGAKRPPPVGGLVDNVALERLAWAADGDAHRALIWLELAAELAEAQGIRLEVALDTVDE